MITVEQASNPARRGDLVLIVRGHFWLALHGLIGLTGAGGVDRGPGATGMTRVHLPPAPTPRTARLLDGRTWDQIPTSTRSQDAV
jgi:hypothetical protein